MAVPVDLIVTFLLRRPRLFRELFAILRRRAPVLRVGNTVVVLGAREVTEVLGRPQDFSNGPVYAPQLKLGPLALEMDAPERHAIERAALTAAITAAQVDALKGSVRRRVDAILAARATRRLRSIDFVTELMEVACTAALCELFHIDPEAARGTPGLLQAPPGMQTFIHWLRKLGGSLAATWPAPFGLEAVTEPLARDLRVFLEAQHLEQYEAGAAIEQRLGSGSAARCIGGLLLAAAAIFRAGTLALGALIEQGELERAVDATDLAAQAEQERVALGFIYEALRFHPPFPVLSRECARATHIGSTPVSAGARVIVALLSAMFDPSAVDHPEEFSTLRPASIFIPFGFGVHVCAGRALAEAGLLGVFLGLFQHQRAHGWEAQASGKIAYDGTAVAQYEIRFGPRPERQNGTDPRDEADRTDNPDRARSEAA